MRIKAVNLAVNSFLPNEMQDDTRTFDKKSIDALLAQIARHHPGKYAAISKQLSDIGRNAAYSQGETLTLNDMKPVIDRDTMLSQMDQEVQQARTESKSDKEFEDKRNGIWAHYAGAMEAQTIAAALQQGNNLGNTVVSGARGKSNQLSAMVTTPGLYTDYKNRIIPLFVRHSFGEGLRPAEYLAGAFGVRKSVVSTKNSTARGGDLLKQATGTANRVVVTEDDCGVANGLDFKSDDPNLEGRVLARDYGKMKAGDAIDRHASEYLRKNFSTVVARSPLTCQAKEGICSKCLGQLSDGKFAHKGYHAGITAASALGEPIAQSALNTKHSGGILSSKKGYSGFDVINQLVQSPETFPHKAAVATSPGRIEKIEDAPQGGQYIFMHGEPIYAATGQDATVKPGDEVEAGEQLSEGIVDPYDVVKYRGLGEGRRYYINRLSEAYKDTGLGTPMSSNLEVLARGALDHVRVNSDEGMGEYLPDDMASYSRVSSNYVSPEDTKFVNADMAADKYLQVPALHFTIGTKLTPKMLKRIKEAGINQVAVSDVEPAFTPDMVRLRAASHTDSDWMARLGSSYLSAGLEQSAMRGKDTDTESNYSYIPRLAKGVGFGKKLEQTGKF
jgi:DNA-directed RNA polymerase subunit beta'